MATKDSSIPIKGHHIITKHWCALGKLTKKQEEPYEALSMIEVWWTIEPHNNKLVTGYLESWTKMTM
jgi:hypothetical protein